MIIIPRNASTVTSTIRDHKQLSSNPAFPNGHIPAARRDDIMARRSIAENADLGLLPRHVVLTWKNGMRSIESSLHRVNREGLPL